MYNDVALKALDQLLADAAKRGLRLVLILARNWGGPDSRAAVSGLNCLSRGRGWKGCAWHELAGAFIEERCPCNLACHLLNPSYPA